MHVPFPAVFPNTQPMTSAIHETGHHLVYVMMMKRANELHPPVKFHVNLSFGLGVFAQWR